MDFITGLALADGFRRSQLSDLGGITRMNLTLRICSWLIIAVAAAMTVFMNLHAMDSVYDPRILLPLALLPYLLLALSVHRVRRRAALVAILAASVATLALGFWIYFDGLFVRLTTLNAPLFIEVPLLQLVLVVIGWMIARQFRKAGVADATQAA